jgi:hypothetical protein
MPKKPQTKPKAKRKPAKRQPKEDFCQIAFRTVQETIRRSVVVQFVVAAVSDHRNLLNSQAGGHRLPLQP